MALPRTHQQRKAECDVPNWAGWSGKSVQLLETGLAQQIHTEPERTLYGRRQHHRNCACRERAGRHSRRATCVDSGANTGPGNSGVAAGRHGCLLR